MVRWSVFAAVAVTVIGAAFVTGAARPAHTAKPPADAKEEPKQVVVVGQRTGYFNMAKVMREHKKAKSAVARLAARKDRMVANIVGLRAMHADLQAVIQRTADPRTKDELTSGLIVLGRRIEDTDREVHKILNNSAGIIIVEIHDEMRQTVAEIAHEHNLV